MQMREWSAEVRDTVREVERNVAFIRDRRKAVTFGPKDADKCVGRGPPGLGGGAPTLLPAEGVQGERRVYLRRPGMQFSCRGAKFGQF